jgi:Sulfotransferase family
MTRLVSLLSAPYSGATLFAIILDRHPLLSCDGETFPPDRGYSMRCSCGAEQLDCEYYRQTAAHMTLDGGRAWNHDLFAHVPRYSRIYPVDRALGGYWLNGAMERLRNFACRVLPPLSRKERQFLDVHERFIKTSLRIKQKPVYVDGSKSVRRAALFAASGRFDHKAIHLIRDGRAFCNSYLKNKKLLRSQLPSAAHFWLKDVRKVDLFHRRFPAVPLLHVRYEDLCDDLKATAMRICDFLEIPYDAAMESQKRGSFHILGNRMRKSFDGLVQKDLAWKTELTPQEIDQITAVMEVALRRFNYLNSSPPPNPVDQRSMQAVRSS